MPLTIRARPLRWAYRSVITPHPIYKSCLRNSPYLNTMADNHNTRALLKSNAKWAAGVSEEDPDFFPNSANNPQTPHVRPFFSYFLYNLHFLFRLFGSVVPIPECQSRSSPPQNLASSLSTETSQSKVLEIVFTHLNALPLVNFPWMTTMYCLYLPTPLIFLELKMVISKKN